MDFFTAPKGKVLKPPPKSPKKAAIDPQPIPTTLVPARSIGPNGTTNSISSQRPPVSPSSPASAPLPSGLVPARKSSLSHPPAASPGASSVSKKTATQSSDAKSSGTAPAPSQPPAAGSGPKPAQNPRPAQPVKRPKQAPSLFIPKKVRSSSYSLLTTVNQSPYFISSGRSQVAEAEGLPTKNEHKTSLEAQLVNGCIIYLSCVELYFILNFSLIPGSRMAESSLRHV